MLVSYIWSSPAGVPIKTAYAVSISLAPDRLILLVPNVNSDEWE